MALLLSKSEADYLVSQHKQILHISNSTALAVAPYRASGLVPSAKAAG